MVDIDDTIIEVHGYAKQGSGCGHSGVRGLSAVLATVTTPATAPVIVSNDWAKDRVAHPEEPHAQSPTHWPRSMSRPPQVSGSRSGST